MRSLLALSLMLAIALSAFTAAPPGRVSPDVLKLIDQLGDDDDDTRKAAEKKLADLGASILPALRQALDKHADPDVRIRAAVLVAELRRRVSGEVRVFKGHTSWAYRVVVLPDGKHAISSGGGVLRLWEVESGKMVRVVAKGKAGGWALGLSKDGKRVVTNYKGELASVFEVESGKLVNTFPGHANQVWATVLSPDGKRLFTGGNTRAQHLYDVDTGKPALDGFAGAKDYCRCAAWSPDGGSIVAGHFDAGASKDGEQLWPGTLRLWDAKTGKELWSATGYKRQVASVAFSRDGKRIVASGLDGGVRVHETATGKELMLLETHKGPVEGAVFSDDEKRIIAVGNEKDQSVSVWDLESRKEIHRFDGHDGGTLSVAVTKDGKHLLTTGKDKMLRLWTMPR